MRTCSVCGLEYEETSSLARDGCCSDSCWAHGKEAARPTVSTREAFGGRIPLSPTRVFSWMRNAKDGEVWGGLLDEKDRVVPGTSGWWRTEDAAEAAKCCALLNGIELEAEVTVPADFVDQDPDGDFVR